MVAMRSWHSLKLSARKTAALAAAGALALGVTAVVAAIEDATLSVERIDGDGWSAEGVELWLGLPGEQSAARAKIARLRLEARDETLRDVRIECPSIRLDTKVIACTDARVAAVLPVLGAQDLRGRVTYEPASGGLALDVSASKLIGGKARVAASVRNAQWRAQIRAERLDLEQALKLANALKLPTFDITGAGRVSMSIDARGGATLTRATVDATVQELTANNASGTLASDKWTFALHAGLTAARGGWDYTARLETQHGQAYVEPVFVDFGVHAATVSGEGRIESDGSIALRTFDIDHRDVFSARGSARIDMAQAQPVRELSLQLRSLQFPGAYASYLQPFLLDTDFKSMQTSGRVSGAVEIAKGVPEKVQLTLDNVSFDDGARTLALEGLRGNLSWRDSPNDDEDAVLRSGAERSSLKWNGGAILNLSLGPSALDFTALGRQVRLVEAAKIPLLDGAIELESFRIRNVGLPSVAFMVDATVRPISVAELCKAFGWPEFGGSVGGQVSKLRLRDGVVTVGTTLQAQVFDGRVAIKDLRLEDALGDWPRFYSSIELANLDLELVTRAFSFGRITGRLSGSIDALQLFNWQPIAFDAKLFTPPGDRSKHRISQRAVENIGSIGGGGGGVTAALSSGFLRFFDDFRYDRLGLSCRLENEVCYMNGVAPAPNGGYYLVKGSGVPRIDVIGGARRVDWPRLVQQLIAVTESGGPVVQ